MELVWKLYILPYNYADLNSHSERSRQVRILGNYQIFPNMFEPPINLVQIQKQFASWIFISNSVLNLNLLPKEKLFIMSQYTLMKSFENC
jgi:hypothetical protein